MDIIIFLGPFLPALPAGWLPTEAQIVTVYSREGFPPSLGPVWQKRDRSVSAVVPAVKMALFPF